MTTVLTGATCPFLLCVISAPHTHPSCPDCGAVRYGNISCATCQELRGDDINPHTIIGGPSAS